MPHKRSEIITHSQPTEKDLVLFHFKTKKGVLLFFK
uniref:Uncharacterized protein n=1 Tax=Arundo donax TaxID=35708 RepID=A0A0A8ZUV0_ARUDO